MIDGYKRLGLSAFIVEPIRHYLNGIETANSYQSVRFRGLNTLKQWRKDFEQLLTVSTKKNNTANSYHYPKEHDRVKIYWGESAEKWLNNEPVKIKDNEYCFKKWCVLLEVNYEAIVKALKKLKDMEDINKMLCYINNYRYREEKEERWKNGTYYSRNREKVLKKQRDKRARQKARGERIT